MDDPLNLSTIVVIIALIMNFGALIWGAATLSATVKFQGIQLERVAKHLYRVAELLGDVEARVRILEKE